MAAALAIMAVPSAQAAVRVVVGPSVGFYYGPGWYRPWGPLYLAAPFPRSGDIKIHAGIKGESIYVDGGFAGLTGKLKKFSLQPGNHQIEIRDAEGRVMYRNTIRVISGQTVDINC
jgi:hypothetical protein